MRAPNASIVCEVSEERDRLNRLAEAHFVSENAVHFLLVQRAEPIEAHKLIFAKLAVE